MPSARAAAAATQAQAPPSDSGHANGHAADHHASLTANLSPEDVSLFTCLSAYADALDALPLDLTRSFSDLRELDAVLGPHMASLVQRIHSLTEYVRDVDVSSTTSNIKTRQRLLLLNNCAEEARSYKMGGEDKIRVALNTCETIMSHTDYIDAILDNLLALPEIKELIEPDQRHHVAGELSDGTPITLASANAATTLAGGSGMFANPSSTGTVGGGPTVGGTGGVVGSYNGMDIDKAAISGPGVKGNKKKSAAAAAAAAAAALDMSAKTSGSTAGKAGNNAAPAASSSSSTTAAGKKRKSGAAALDDDATSSTKAAAGKKGGARKKAATAAGASLSGPSGRNNGAGVEGASPAAASYRGEGSSSRAGAASKNGNADEHGSHGRRGGASSTTTTTAAAAAYGRGDVSRAGSEAQYDESRSPAIGSSANGGGSARARAARAPRGSSSRRGGAAGGRYDDGEGNGVDGGQEDEETQQQQQQQHQQPLQTSSSSSSRRRGGGDDNGSALGLHVNDHSGEGAGPSSSNQRHDVHSHSRPTSERPDPSHANTTTSNPASSNPIATAVSTGGGPSSINGDEPDDTRYCFCNNVSYGDMIGCDNDDCEREWFHLECVGLTRPPSGTWYCDECLDSRAAKAAKTKAKKPRVQRTSGTHGGGGTEYYDVPATASGKSGGTSSRSGSGARR